MTRYFRRRDERVARALQSAADSSLFASDFDQGAKPNWEEVQVVPMDAIVVLPDDLPKVEVDNFGLFTNGVDETYAYIGNNHRDPLALAVARALGNLAIAEHLRKNPPEDEAQVTAVLRVLKEVIDGADRETAVDLVRAGLRAEKKES